MRFFLTTFFFVLILLSHITYGQETTSRLTPEAVTNNAVQVLEGPLRFESNRVYYVHPSALEGVTQLTLDNLQNTWIHFLAPLKGSQMYWATYGDSEGILNVTDCDALTISGLDVENEYTFQPGNVILETSCAVNVSRSNVTFRDCNITGNGKSAMVVHSGSLVGLYDSTVNAYYFEVQVGGSTLLVGNCVFNQDHVTPDSHSAIWTSSSARNGVTNVLYENTNVTLTDTTFNMADGRSIITGNGSYTTMSNVTLVRPTFNFTDPTHGIVTWHENYNSITVVFDEVVIPGLVDYVSTPVTGFGRFVNYYTPPTTPGGVGGVAPITVDGVSSGDITP